MIITVTLNPAIDKTAELANLQVGELNRMQNVITDISGKGINVSKMINNLGGTSVATGFIGSDSYEDIVNTLQGMGIETDFVKSQGTTRTNLKIIDSDGRLTELNEPGITVTESEITKLLESIAKRAVPNTIFVLSGSLCQGVDSEFYAKLIRIIHNHQGLAFLDADGDAFKAAIMEKPDFIKPNQHELLEYFNVKEQLDLEGLKELCQRLGDMGIPKIALSLGKEGAMFYDRNTCTYADGLNVLAHSPAGAGDSMMGAFAYGTSINLPWNEISRLSLATSAGAVTTIGTKPPSKELIDELLPQVELRVLKVY